MTTHPAGAGRRPALAIGLGLVVALGAAGSAAAFEPNIENVIAGLRAGKPLASIDLAHAMASGERWCYAEEEGTCLWSDIYLDVREDGALFELESLWAPELGMAHTGRVLFEANRFLCEAPGDWADTMRAWDVATGAMVGGRPLHALRTEFAEAQAWGEYCYDYLFISASEANSTLTLRQRVWHEGETDALSDVEVTVHFDAERAQALAIRW